MAGDLPARVVEAAARLEQLTGAATPGVWAWRTWPASGYGGQGPELAAPADPVLEAWGDDTVPGGYGLTVSDADRALIAAAPALAGGLAVLLRGLAGEHVFEGGGCATCHLLDGDWPCVTLGLALALADAVLDALDGKA